jgi:AmmeMemoRadiSam system protein B
MINSDFKPILRQVDAIPGTVEGKPFLFLRDPVGFVDEVLPIPQEVVFLLSYMDGNHDLRDLQALATQRFGQIVPFEEMVKFVQTLDEKGFLWSPTFEKLKERVYEAWFALPARPMAHADISYPLDPEEAKAFVEEILKLEPVDGVKLPRILIAPHIDLRVGAKCYASSYKRFKLPPGSRVIILGVGHYLDYPFSVLTKDMHTPFGLLRFDRGGYFYLANSKKLELFPNHIVHRREHSIEFQALFLRSLGGDSIVSLPILVGSHHLLEAGGELTDRFVEGLADLVDDTTYIVLGIDFCHLGLRYGDPFPAGDEIASLALRFDKRVLELAFQGETQALKEELSKNEPLKCCGSGCLYLLAKLIATLKAKATGEIYKQEALPFGEGSIVTVVSAGANI